MKQWDNETKAEFFAAAPDEQAKYIFIEEHPKYKAYFLVNSVDITFIDKFGDLVNQLRSVPKVKVHEFIDKATELNFILVFMNTKFTDLVKFAEGLDEPYPYTLNITLKQFQLRGWNYIKDLDSAIINWSTGTGKSVLTIAHAKYLLERGEIDKVLVLSKKHNKINWQRAFKNFGELEAVTDDVGGAGTAVEKRAKRLDVYTNNPIIIVNYEKLGNDYEEFAKALKDKKVLWCWDEMTNKMKSMRTKWYKATLKLQARTAVNRQLELTAKKLDTDPENVYSCTKILDSTIWPNLATFRTLYAKSMSPFNHYQVQTWNAAALPEIGMRLAHMTSIANKYTDPLVAAEFPQDHWEDLYVEMSKEDRKLYDVVKNAIIRDIETGVIKQVSPFQTTIPLQLVCNNPEMINKSDSKIAMQVKLAHLFTDKHCNKLEALKDLLEQIDSKVVLFSAFNEFGTRMLMDYLTKWNQSFVLYDGTEKQMQKAQDLFQNNDYVKIFLSSDKGSDSINLEQATTVINYDLPWNHSTLIQRVNRISRLTSEAEHVYYYNLIVANSLEEKKMKILERKRKYEELIDQPIADVNDSINSIDELLNFLS